MGISESGREFRIKGIECDKELANQFSRKLNAVPMNPIFVFAPFMPIPDSKVLAVISIPKSSRGPYILSRIDQRIFWKRTNSGLQENKLAN